MEPPNPVDFSDRLGNWFFCCIFSPATADLAGWIVGGRPCQSKKWWIAMKKTITFLTLFVLLLVAGASVAETRQVLIIEVRGLNCPFCAYDVGVALMKMPGVYRADIDLAENQARVFMLAGRSPDEEQIRAVIIAEGLTPGTSELQTEET
jgi:copper chaperone CopZ